MFHRILLIDVTLNKRELSNQAALINRSAVRLTESTLPEMILSWCFIGVVYRLVTFR